MTTKQSLPKGWRWAKLGDICEQDRRIIEPNSIEATRLIYLGLEYIESNTGRILREPAEPINNDEGKSTSFAFDTRHVLYGKLRPYLNKVALPEFEGRCTTELIPLLPKETDRNFLAWLLRRSETVSAAMQGKTGSRMPRANMGELLTLEIPVPPLDVQKRIAARLDEQMRHIEQARQAAEERLSAAWDLKSAYLRDVFEGENSKSWIKKPLSAICTITMGQSPKGNTYNSKGDGYPLLNGPTEFGFEHPTPAQWTTSPVRVAEKGDILFCVRGATTGRKNFADQQYCIGRGLAGIRAQKGQATTQFIYHLLDVVTFELLKQTAGSIFPNLSGDKLENFEAFIPSADEQESIVKHLKLLLGETENINNSLESQLAEINELPSALLRQAFAGEL